MLDDEKNATEAVAMAMVNGYRHFDCATAYQNQVFVGKGLAEGLKRTGLNRSEIWVSSKLWSTRYVPSSLLPPALKLKLRRAEWWVVGGGW